MCGTIPQGASQGIHLLRAYAVEAGVVVAQESVARKENELVAAPRLLKGLNLRDKIVSGDAMVAQRDLSIQTVEVGGVHWCGCGYRTLIEWSAPKQRRTAALRQP